jgi:hypothetical protein
MSLKFIIFALFLNLLSIEKVILQKSDVNKSDSIIRLGLLSRYTSSKVFRKLNFIFNFKRNHIFKINIIKNLKRN